MKRQVRKVTKQLPAKAFTEAARKLLFTVLRAPVGLVADA
jgi:hypothetical protein